ncbi:MAG: acetyl/propionyl/methylcrotonyl-CoA carboxylase subunit alpha [SAR324 cluster bacterium]|nr:acetyl/propionyl/methylcrotonyl-CoA carboxylase subunit alpha [SAR324 cluster bacterium]
MFRKILIANRGEIACRVIRTAKRMGIHCVAVYSEADANAPHVKMADEALYLGGSPAGESYLRGEKILEIAKNTGAEAIHPGYGFLSENADFARQCEAQGVVFIGPPSEAIVAMGSKSMAKAIMEKAGVPLVPGYHGDNQDPEHLAREAEKTGYPVLLKAVAGGGGKGMRVVKHPADFVSSLEAAQREATSSFGNSVMLLERYVQQPRHVEIQVFTDTHGNGVYLFERDCSVQRRHQKIIEEAPAPGLAPETRKKMGETAVEAAKVIGYVGAGTVEFLLDANGAFYFMEMNTRLQVEHPVTEMITGQDLVEWQLRVASGELLPLKQDQLQIHGHAFETRIYAEDPENQFLPSTGTLHYLRPPETSPNVRIDTGVTEGDAVTVYYDPMIAKLIVWDQNRKQALSRMSQALADYHVAGVKTNIEFLHRITENESFRKGGVDTHFIENNREFLFAELPEQTERAAVLGALFEVFNRQRRNEHLLNPQDQWSPWLNMDGWRLNEPAVHEIRFRDSKGKELLICLHEHGAGHFLAEIGSHWHEIFGKLENGILSVTLNKHKFDVSVVAYQQTLTIFMEHQRIVLEQVMPDLGEGKDHGHEGNLSAPMNGTVIKVMVNKGDKVEKDQPLVIMEAMKMEHTIRAVVDGVVQEIFFSPGELVQEGVALLEISKQENH